MTLSTSTFVLAIATGLSALLPESVFKTCLIVAFAVGMAIVQYIENTEAAEKERLAKKLQDENNLLLQKIHKYTTGGNNKPLISIVAGPMMRAPGQEERDAARPIKYKQVFISISNIGDTPIRYLKIKTDSALGIDVNVPDPNYYFASNKNVFELRDTVIAPGQTIPLLTANYQTWTNFVEIGLKVEWDFGFYHQKDSYRYPVLWGPLKLESRILLDKYVNPVNYDEYFPIPKNFLA